MTYEETLQFLYDHLPMFQRIGPAAYKKDLTNTLKLCAILNNPQEKFASIHVGGTNGKGSVSNMLASVLFEEGYNTGLYTSPHLIDFRERIRVNGELCEKEFVIDFVERIKPHIAEIQPSFFEITVAMAFDYFVYKEIDVAVVEVGLGGRLDSTNVINPTLSIITNISYDHTNMLGNTIMEIAAEKAGIIKPHVPVVIGEYHTESFDVFREKALAVSAPDYLAEENVEIEIIEKSVSHLVVNASYLNQLLYPNLEIGLTADYQIRNIKTVIQAIEIMREREIEISDEAVYDGLKKVLINTGFRGRLQILSRHPLVICDCAHNAAGLNALFTEIGSMQYGQLHIVTGIVNDKDPQLNLKEYPEEAAYYFCTPDIPRGMDSARLKELAGAYHLDGSNYGTVKRGMDAALANAGKDDLILICGSIFVVAEALENVSGE